MKILAIWRVKEGADMGKVKDYLVEEERFAWRSYLDDVLREHYESDMPTSSRSLGRGVEAAKQIFADLSLLREGLITAEYYPPSVPELEVLFRGRREDGLAGPSTRKGGQPMRWRSST